MNKITILLFFISLHVASQKKLNLDYSISEIDSLSKKESCLIIHDLGGSIKAEKRIASNNIKETKIIVGNGYGGIKTHAYFTDSIGYASLSRNEKKYYDNKKTCKFIRADYNAIINFEDGTFYKESTYFYYDKNELFYIEYNESDFDDNKLVKTHYSLFVFEFDDKLKNREDLKNWILEKDKEIVKSVFY
jgi:hypothetical protein